MDDSIKNEPANPCTLLFTLFHRISLRVSTSTLCHVEVLDASLLGISLSVKYPKNWFSLTLCDFGTLGTDTQKCKSAVKSVRVGWFVTYTRAFTQSEGEPKNWLI